MGRGSSLLIFEALIITQIALELSETSETSETSGKLVS